MKRITTRMLGLLLITMLTLSARGGAPLSCHQIDIGNAKSLPWGKDTFDKGGSYDLTNLSKDTLEILTPNTPIVVRMETLRRAAMHVGKNTVVAEELLGRLMARVINAEAAGQPDALAYFDAGYLAGCYDQCGVAVSFGPALRKDDGGAARGGAWVERAIVLSGDSKAAPQMHLAAALMFAGSHQKAAQTAHLRAALAAGAGKDSKAEQGILEWIATINGTTLDSLRSELGLASAAADSRGGGQ